MDHVTMVMECSAYNNNSIISAMVLSSPTRENPFVISGKPFKTEKAALEYIDQLKDNNQPYKIGIMQIPSFWLKNNPVSSAELLRPCKNMVEATEILNKVQANCGGTMDCALSMYKTGNAYSGLNYANQIIQYATDHPFITPPPLE